MYRCDNGTQDFHVGCQSQSYEVSLDTSWEKNWQKKHERQNILGANMYVWLYEETELGYRCKYVLCNLH